MPSLGSRIGFSFSFGSLKGSIVPSVGISAQTVICHFKQPHSLLRSGETAGAMVRLVTLNATDVEELDESQIDWLGEF